MTFWEIFFRLLPHRPKQALAALYWHLTRRRVRARNRLRVASADLQFAYDLWIARVERTGELKHEFLKAVKQWHWRPQFSVLLHARTAYRSEQLVRSVKSVEEQIYPYWTMVDTSVDSFETAIAAAEADFLIPLRIGDALSEAALFHIAEAIQTDRSAAILYGDHDHFDMRGRRSRPWFKPGWNEEMFLAQDFISSAVAVKTDLARLLRSDAPHDLSSLLLAATSEAGKIEQGIVHVPHILCHVDARDEEQSRRLEQVARHVRARDATCVPGPFGTVKVVWPLPYELPFVSVIVPTKDKLDLLRPCVESVLQQTEYDNFELLIVDNASVERRTAEFLNEIKKNTRVRVLDYPGAYNFSAINNFAARQSRGSFLCLLNNDTEVLESGWLTDLMRYAARPDVGAVGAKLLYEDGSIQHAGVVLGLGQAAGHAHRFQPGGDPGYFRMPHVAQFVSAITAACLVVDKGKFLAVGGLDEEGLAVAFNDVDLCLKLQAAGWRNVYVPHAVLVHHESKSRGRDSSPLNIDRYRRELKILQERWSTTTYTDPLHNPNLDRDCETFVIRF